MGRKDIASPIDGGDNIFAAPCKSVAFHFFFPVSSLLVSLFYSSAVSCRGSGPCALAPPISLMRTLSQNDARVTASPMLNLNVRSKPAAVGVRSTFFSLRFPSVFIWNQKRATNSPVFFKTILGMVLSILGMDKVRSTAWKTYVRVCFSSGLMVSLESICLLWRETSDVSYWDCMHDVFFSLIFARAPKRGPHPISGARCGNLEDQCSLFPLTSASKQGAANDQGQWPLFELGSEGSENSLVL